MKRIRRALLFSISLLLFANLFSIPTLAGERTSTSNYVDAKGQINESDWNKTDENIICKEGKLIIPSDTSNADTKFISKVYSVVDTSVEEMISASATLRITELPQGEKFVLAFGMRGIEAASGDAGNIEIGFVNDGGIKVSVVAYGDDGETTLLENKKVDISLQTQFQFAAGITSKGVLTVKINGNTIYQGKPPINGEGRFGIVQTGGCGAEFSELTVKCHYYDRPENTNIFEDFEDGELNINELVSWGSSNGMEQMNMRIEDYNGSKVLMFRNVALAWFGTTHTYSNFELSFDVPYYLRQNVYDDNEKHIYNPTQRISIGFGEEASSPKIGNEYLTDVDLIDIGTTYLSSRLANKFAVDLTEQNFFDINSVSDGFSVKLSVVDGHAEVYMKKLSGSSWTLLTTADYEEFRSGYIYLWVTENGNFAIDNFKLVNKDTEPKLIETEYLSSVIEEEDYVLTEEETEMKFRPTDNTDTDDGKSADATTYILIGSALGLMALIVVLVILKRRKVKGGLHHEE